MKSVVLSRRYGDYLIRDNKKYEATGIKNKNFISVSMSDSEGSYYKRSGYDVNSLKDATTNFVGFNVKKVASANVPQDANAQKAAINQGLVTIEKASENVYNVKADFSKLEAYTSTDATQAKKGNLKWIGLLIATGKETVVGLKYNNYTLTAGDASEAAGLGGAAGDFVLWTYVEERKITFLLTNTDGVSSSITINFVNVPTAQVNEEPVI